MSVARQYSQPARKVETKRKASGMNPPHRNRRSSTSNSNGGKSQPGTVNATSRDRCVSVSEIYGDLPHHSHGPMPSEVPLPPLSWLTNIPSKAILEISEDPRSGLPVCHSEPTFSHHQDYTSSSVPTNYHASLRNGLLLPASLSPSSSNGTDSHQSGLQELTENLRAALGITTPH